MEDTYLSKMITNLTLLLPEFKKVSVDKKYNNKLINLLSSITPKTLKIICLINDLEKNCITSNDIYNELNKILLYLNTLTKSYKKQIIKNAIKNRIDYKSRPREYYKSKSQIPIDIAGIDNYGYISSRTTIPFSLYNEKIWIDNINDIKKKDKEISSYLLGSYDIVVTEKEIELILPVPYLMGFPLRSDTGYFTKRMIVEYIIKIYNKVEKRDSPCIEFIFYYPEMKVIMVLIGT